MPIELCRLMTHNVSGDDASPLSGVDKDRWDAVRAQVAALSDAVRDGSLDDETLAGGVAALTQVPLDTQAVLDALHVPQDAGVYAAGLERMLRRIPDGWGRWVRCDAGWYPLLVELDLEIAALLPEYEIHQMKEKFGTLRFYWSLPELKASCCKERLIADPRPAYGPVPAHLAPKDRTTEVQSLMEEWLERELAHLESQEHHACEEEMRSGPEAARRAAAIPLVTELVAQAEIRSSSLCERCSAPGSLKSHGYQVKTLCGPCSVALGYHSNTEDC